MVYLHLFHGRTTAEEDMNDWGEDGPVLGPLSYVHTTYGTDIKITHAQSGEDGSLTIVGDMVRYGGKLYGDWSVFGSDALTEDKLAPQVFSQEEADRGTPTGETVDITPESLKTAEGRGKVATAVDEFENATAEVANAATEMYDAWQRGETEEDWTQLAATIVRRKTAQEAMLRALAGR